MSKPMPEEGGHTGYVVIREEGVVTATLKASMVVDTDGVAYVETEDGGLIYIGTPGHPYPLADEQDEL